MKKKFRIIISIVIILLSSVWCVGGVLEEEEILPQPEVSVPTQFPTATKVEVEEGEICGLKVSELKYGGEIYILANGKDSEKFCEILSEGTDIIKVQILSDEEMLKYMEVGELVCTLSNGGGNFEVVVLSSGNDISREFGKWVCGQLGGNDRESTYVP